MSKENEKLFSILEDEIKNNDEMSEASKTKMIQNMLKMKEERINLLITGATGCGKSSTINALFNMEKAKVGVTPNPETMEIQKFELDNLVLWDSPGLGDGKEADTRHAKNIINKLYEKDNKGNLLIDLVLVILDGGSRDLGTSYELINSVIIPNLGEDKENRILVAINQCDVAMKGKHWNNDEHKPDTELIKFLDEKVLSVKRRVKEATGVNVDPIYYSAGFKEEGLPQEPPYNISKLLLKIVKFVPSEKRLLIAQNMNQDENMWKGNDELENYNQELAKEYRKSFMDHITEGADVGREIGGIFGPVGEAVGGVVGGIIGGIGGAISEIFGGGGCYITTATCEEYEKPDDCYELTAFRNFRDNYLLHQRDGKTLIKQYYDTAPQIVELINNQPNRKEIYKNINDNYLSKCLKYIERDENELCKQKYIEMMEYLYERKSQWEL